MIKAQQDALFGKKSEASKSKPDEESSGEDTPENNSHAGTTTVAAHTRKTRGSRTLDTKSLPKYTVIHDLLQEQKECACCGKPLHLIGQEKSEQLELIPSRYCIIAYSDEVDHRFRRKWISDSDASGSVIPNEVDRPERSDA